MPWREFLHVDDLADAPLLLLSLENPPDWINVGTGTDVTKIAEGAETETEPEARPLTTDHSPPTPGDRLTDHRSPTAVL